MTNYKRGYGSELAAMERLRGEGYYPIRSAGSHGLIDVVGISDTTVRLVQVKHLNRTVHTYSKDANIRAFGELRVPDNCTKEVWCSVLRPIGGKMRRVFEKVML